MREIKFRVWDNIAKKYIDGRYVSISGLGLLHVATGEPIEYWVVKFADGGFIGECAGVAEPLFELTQLEVVGNIHENSELVGEK